MTYSGYLLFDSGYKITFSDIEEDELDGILQEAYDNNSWKAGSDEIIWLADSNTQIIASKIVGYQINQD